MSPVGWLLLVLALAGVGPTVPGPELPPAEPELTRVAEAFVGFARGEVSSPPADTPVELLVAGRVLSTISGGDVLDARRWRVCGESDGYAGRTCPFSALDAIATSPTGVVVTSAAPRHPCLHAPAPPARLSVYRTVTLTGGGSPTCADHWAVELFVNDVGQVVAVDLVLTEP